MNELVERLKELEAILELTDPRPKIGSYHDLPYAIFRYDPEDEFELRKQVTLLETRLSQRGKRVTRISLAECLFESMASVRPFEDWFGAEREQGVETVVQTVHSILSDHSPSLVELVAKRLPGSPNPLGDIVLLTRAGALFPVYRCHTILEQLHGLLTVPGVLFYPGTLDGPSLRFMGVQDADPNYRPKIF